MMRTKKGSRPPSALAGHLDRYEVVWQAVLDKFEEACALADAADSDRVALHEDLLHAACKRLTAGLSAEARTMTFAILESVLNDRPPLLLLPHAPPLLPADGLAMIDQLTVARERLRIATARAGAAHPPAWVRAAELRLEAALIEQQDTHRRLREAFREHQRNIANATAT